MSERPVAYRVGAALRPPAEPAPPREPSPAAIAMLEDVLLTLFRGLLQQRRTLLAHLVGGFGTLRLEFHFRAGQVTHTHLEVRLAEEVAPQKTQLPRS